MAWFKIDDTFPHHAKVIAAGNPAIGLWVRAGAWSMQQLTDGFVPTHVAGILGTKAEARRLVSAGLWLDADGGYQFHDWSEVQRTKEQVKADRHAATERQRKAREAALSRRESRRDNTVSHAVSHGPPVSQPPDQTRPDQTSNYSAGDVRPSEPAPAAPKQPRKKPATALPDDWRPTEDHLTRCREGGIDPATELAKFRAHAEANDRRQVNWNAAFTQWLLNARPTSNVWQFPTPQIDEQGRVLLPPLSKGIFE